MLVFKSDTTPSSKLFPFLFRKESTKDSRYFVSVASFNYTDHDYSWACNEIIGNYPLVPDTDLVCEIHQFDSEGDAIQFIASWWKQQFTDKV